MSYLTPAELEAAQGLHRDAPYGIMNVSHGQLSIARHYGGLTFRGSGYTYIPATDELIRDDVMKLVEKMRRAKPAEPADDTQLPLNLEAE